MSDKCLKCGREFTTGDHPFKELCNKCQNHEWTMLDAHPGYEYGYTAGLAEGFRRAREAIKNVVTYSMIGIGPALVARHDALAAIDEAEKEVKT